MRKGALDPRRGSSVMCEMDMLYIMAFIHFLLFYIDNCGC